MKLLQWITVFGCCALCLSTRISAKQANAIYVATGEWPPYFSDQVAHKGCIAKLIKDAFHRQGIKVHFTFMPWIAAYARSKKGLLDATAYWYDRPDRRADFIFSGQPIHVGTSYFFYNKSAPVDFQSWADLSGKTIILNKGYHYAPGFEQTLKQNNISTYTVAHDKLNLKMLYMKRGDLAIMAEKPFKVFISQLSPNVAEQIARHDFPPLINKGYLLFSRNVANSPIFKAAFDKGFERLMDNPDYKHDYITQCSPILPL